LLFGKRDQQDDKAFSLRDKVPKRTDKNYFQGLKIYNQALKINNQTLKIYFQALKIILYYA